MSYIGKKIESFEADAYQNGTFIIVTDQTDAG